MTAKFQYPLTACTATTKQNAINAIRAKLKAANAASKGQKVCLDDKRKEDKECKSAAIKIDCTAKRRRRRKRSVTGTGEVAVVSKWVLF